MKTAARDHCPNRSGMNQFHVERDAGSARADSREHGRSPLIRGCFVHISVRKVLFVVALAFCAAAIAKPETDSGTVAVKPTPTQAQTA